MFPHDANQSYSVDFQESITKNAITTTGDLYTSQIDEFPLLPSSVNEDNIVETFDQATAVPLLTYKTITPALSEFQIHLVPENTKKTKRPHYIVVILFCRQFLDCSSMVGCCSLCSSSKYNMRRYTAVFCAPLQHSETLSCMHIKFAVTQVCLSLGILGCRFPLQKIALLCTQNQEQKEGFWDAGYLQGCSKPLHVFISSDFCIGLFTVVRGQWRCYLCRSHTCIHKKSVKKFPKVHTVPTDNNATPETDLLCHILESRTRYKFLDPPYWRALHERSKNFENFLDNNFSKKQNIYIVIPEKKTAVVGLLLNLHRSQKNALLLGQ